jgi:hypothetical protein
MQDSDPPADAGSDSMERVMELRERIARGEYEVDPQIIAEVLLERLREAARRAADQAQNECSYPDSVLSPSPKLRPGGPATTRPIHVRLRVAAALSAIRRALGGMQTQSS